MVHDDGGHVNMINEILSASGIAYVRQMQQCRGPVPGAFASYHASLVKLAKQGHIDQK